MNIQSVGIVGAGQMGNGIAHVFAQAGFDVLMTDISQEALDKAVALIARNLDRQVSKGRIAQADRDAAMGRIRTTLKLADLGQTDLVIEAATERETVKQAIFEDLLPHLKPTTILTSNTSSISITRLASRTDRPEKFMGFHFMNPVPVMELVELIRGIATDDATFEASREFVQKLGKRIAVSEDFPAFIVNRILLPMINEAVYTLYEGVGTVEAIDTAMKKTSAKGAPGNSLIQCRVIVRSTSLVAISLTRRGYLTQSESGSTRGCVPVADDVSSLCRMTRPAGQSVVAEIVVLLGDHLRGVLIAGRMRICDQGDIETAFQRRVDRVPHAVVRLGTTDDQFPRG